MNWLKKYFNTFFLVELIQGLRLTGRYFLSPKITVQFPEEETPRSPRFQRITCAASLS